MLNENDFINSVWDKYEDYSFKNKNNDKFFKKKVYRNSEYILVAQYSNNDVEIVNENLYNEFIKDCKS